MLDGGTGKNVYKSPSPQKGKRKKFTHFEYFKQELHPQPKISMFCALAQNY